MNEVIGQLSSTWFGEWLRREGIPGEKVGEIGELAGGTQNLLLTFSYGDQQHVLRSGQRHGTPNKLLEREIRVLRALAGTDVPHAPIEVWSLDNEPIGRPFYIMKAIDGGNVLDEESALPDLALTRAPVTAVEGLAELALLDYKRLGLEGFGRPDGFLERQVSRWKSELEKYRQYEGYDRPRLPGITDVESYLESRSVTSQCIGLIHGDYHMGNVLIGTDGSLAAIIDWEMATIGDPILDLARFMAVWPDGGPLIDPTTAYFTNPRLPSHTELIEIYARRTGLDLSAIEYYEVLACYRLAVVLEASYAKALAGLADMNIGQRLHAIGVNLIERAARIIAGR